MRAAAETTRNPRTDARNACKRRGCHAVISLPKALSRRERMGEPIMRRQSARLMLIAIAVSLLLGYQRSGAETIQDEAMRAGRAEASMPAADEDYFRDMDGGIVLTPVEI